MAMRATDVNTRNDVNGGCCGYKVYYKVTLLDLWGGRMEQVFTAS